MSFSHFYFYDLTWNRSSIINQNNTINLWRLLTHATLQKEFGLLTYTFYQNINGLTYKCFVFFTTYWHLSLHNPMVTLFFYIFRDLISHFSARSVVLWRIFETSNSIKLLFFDKAQKLLKLFISFTRKAHDKLSSNHGFWYFFSDQV